jgi:hypothetical protein
LFRAADFRWLARPGAVLMSVCGGQPPKDRAYQMMDILR